MTNKTTPTTTTVSARTQKHAIYLAFVILSSLHSLSIALPNFIVLGVPGSGKGTLSQYLTERYGYNHVSIGDLIRSHVQQKTEIGLKIQDVVKNGEHIDDTITVKLIAEKIEEFCAKQTPFIIDGYPRNQHCLDELTKLLDTLKVSSTVHLIYIDAGDDTCKQRIAQRLICAACARTSSGSLCQKQDQAAQDLTSESGEVTAERITYVQRVICKCGAELSKRDFDDAATTAKRISSYRQNTAPIIAELKLYYPVHFFNTDCSLEECFAAYELLMRQLITA